MYSITTPAFKITAKHVQWDVDIKALFFCRNNGWITEFSSLWIGKWKHGQGAQFTKTGADSLAENTPNPLEFSARAQKFWNSMKKGFIGLMSVVRDWKLWSI